METENLDIEEVQETEGVPVDIDGQEPELDDTGLFVKEDVSLDREKEDNDSKSEYELSEEEQTLLELPREDFVEKLLENADPRVAGRFQSIVDKLDPNMDNMELDAFFDNYSKVVEEEFEAQVDTLDSEYSKLTPTERNELESVMGYWESKLGPGSEAFIDNIFSTADGFRHAKMMMENSGQGLPAYSPSTVKAPTLTQSDLHSFREKISEASEVGDFSKVRELKDEMKRAIIERGTDALKRDLAGFLNN